MKNRGRGFCTKHYAFLSNRDLEGILTIIYWDDTGGVHGAGLRGLLTLGGVYGYAREQVMVLYLVEWGTLKKYSVEIVTHKC
jgi:hypothetical protein